MINLENASSKPSPEQHKHVEERILIEKIKYATVHPRHNRNPLTLGKDTASYYAGLKKIATAMEVGPLHVYAKVEEGSDSFQVTFRNRSTSPWSRT